MSAMAVVQFGLAMTLFPSQLAVDHRDDERHVVVDLRADELNHHYTIFTETFPNLPRT